MRFVRLDAGHRELSNKPKFVRNGSLEADLTMKAGNFLYMMEKLIFGQSE